MSVKKMFKRNSPRIDPRGTPIIISDQLLMITSTFVFYFLFDMQSVNSRNASSLNPHALSFVVSNSEQFTVDTIKCLWQAF